MALPKNSEEILALEKFQEKVEDLKLNKGTLMRFLRARNLDLVNAESMLRAYKEWMENNVYEAAIKNGWKPPPQLIIKFKVSHCGVDSEGRAVFYIHFDNWMPSRHIFEEFEAFEILCFTYKTFLTLYEDISKTTTQQIVAILDNQDIGFTKILHEVQYWKGVQNLIDIWQLYEANFPETLHKAFFINTARAFMWGFNLIKPFVTKQTLSKISIFGTDESKWKPVLHASLPMDVIPSKFGGCAEEKNVYDIVYDGIATKLYSTHNTILK